MPKQDETLSRTAETLSRTAFSAVMGVDKSQVTRWATQGLPVAPDGRVIAAAGAAWVRQNVDGYKIRGTVGAAQMRFGDRERQARHVASAYSTGDTTAALYIAELTLPLLPLPIVRALAGEMLRKMRVGSIECLEMDHRPPTGFASWADTEQFKEDAPAEGDWEYLLEEHAAGNLKVVTSDE